MHFASMLVALVCVASAWACGGERRTTGDAGADAGEGLSDAEAPDASEAGAADAGPPGCVDLATPGVDFPIDPDGPATQIHAAAAFDGEAVWVVYNRPEPGDTGNFDVWAVRLRCDGTPLHGPVRVNTTVEPNDVDPDLAVSDGRVLIVWHSDDGAFPDNLSIGYRVLALDGTPLMEADARLVSLWEGEDVTGNHWEPSAAPAPEGGFVIAGARATPAASTFQVFAQRVDADGARVGDTLHPVLEPDVSQRGASVTFRSGRLQLAWTRDDGTSEQAWLAELPDGEPRRILETADAAAQPHQEGPWLAVSTTAGGDQGVHLLLVDSFDRRLGEPGRVEHTPRVTDGAVAFLRNVSGIRNDLILQTFGTSSTDGLFVGPEHAVASDVPPYQPAVTHLGSPLYLVVWSAGESPDFRLVGRVLGS